MVVGCHIPTCPEAASNLKELTETSLTETFFCQQFFCQFWLACGFAALRSLAAIHFRLGGAFPLTFHVSRFTLHASTLQRSPPLNAPRSPALQWSPPAVP